MRILLIGSMLITAPSAPLAPPGFTDRFVTAKSGYAVESREVDGWPKRGRHRLESGSTFRLKVSPGGRGRSVDYRPGAGDRDTGLAARQEYPAGAK